MLTKIVSSADDMALCLALRREVFIDEQGVPADLELDGEDDVCTHVVVVDDDGVCVGTARVRHKDGRTAKVQRVAVKKSARQAGVGRAVMGAVEDVARSWGKEVAFLSSQTSAIPFYERLGYVASGPIYDDAGIPHRDMNKSLSSSGS